MIFVAAFVVAIFRLARVKHILNGRANLFSVLYLRGEVVSQKLGFGRNELDILVFIVLYEMPSHITTTSLKFLIAPDIYIFISNRSPMQ